MNAEQKLRNFRFDDSDLARILKDNDTRPLLDITTPLGGTVVFRHAVLGEAVEPTTKLYTVADTSTFWLWVDVYERDISKVEPGQKVTFTVMGGGPEETPTTFAGKVTWVGSEVDQTTQDDEGPGRAPQPQREAPGPPVRQGSNRSREAPQGPHGRKASRPTLRERGPRFLDREARRLPAPANQGEARRPRRDA